MTADLKPCGTRAAYRRHQRHNERPCALCRAWFNASRPGPRLTWLSRYGHLVLIPGVVTPAGLCCCPLNEAHWAPGCEPGMTVPGGRVEL